ncbi:MAG: extracellular solute-binding protein [Pseudomonadota bacterium]
MRFGLLTNILIALISNLVVLHAAIAHAQPLRIWVMQNEPVFIKGPITNAQIQEAVKAWREDKGIIIENSVTNLSLPAETENPLAGYIVGHNQILEELAIFRRAQGSHEPIAIEFIRWEDAFNRISNALTSNDILSVPDIVQIGSTWVASFADMGTLVDLTDQFIEEDFFPPSIQSAKVFGTERLFAVPWFVDARLLYYHKDMISSASQVANWEALSSTCQTFAKSKDRRLLGIPITITWNLLHDLAPWLCANGGGILEPTQFGGIHAHRVILDSPSSFHAIKYLKNLAEFGCLDFPRTTQEMTDQKFINGEYAAIITGPWIIKRLGDDWQKSYGVALPPAGPEGSFPFVGGSHLAISKASIAHGNFERAVALIRHFTSPDAQKAYVESTGFLPANRAALQNFFDKEGTDIFKKALENGRSYPSIPEWGSVVENELIRTHIWHIWRDISQVVSDETLRETAHNAASALKTKLIYSLAKRYAPTGALALGIAGLLGSGSIIWWRRRFKKTRKQFEQKSLELKRIQAERALLEGKALILERRREEQTEKLSLLSKELAKLKEKADRLSAEDVKQVGPFSVNSAGSLYIDAHEVHFENNRQAKRLIEYLARQACVGVTEVHCLWGYPLFGWELNKIQSHPKRLFETMASKINGRLKALGYPAIIIKAGKKSCSWKLCWDVDTINKNSDIHQSMSLDEAASQSIDEGYTESACIQVITALELDPKNIDALIKVRHMLSKEGSKLSAHKGRMESLLKISEHILAQHIDLLKTGIVEIEQMIKENNLPEGIDAEVAVNELNVMKIYEEYMSKRFHSIYSNEAHSEKPLLLQEIQNRICSIQNEIISMKSNGVSADGVWAQVVGSRSFERLLAIPRIKTMVNNFYNHSIQSREDPRLVQLALISMLSSSQSLKHIGAAKDEGDLLGMINRELKKELLSLENQIESISVM